MKLRFLSPQVSDASEVLHLKLWDGFTLPVVAGVSDGTVFDYSLNGNEGVIDKDNAVTVPAYPGFSFDGANSLITVAADSSIDANAKTALTISVWINPASDGENNFGRIIDHANDATTLGYLFRVDSESGNFVNCFFKIVTSGTDIGIELASALIPLNQWSHIVFTHDTGGDNKARIYLNGILMATDTASTGTYSDDSAETLIIGNTSVGSRTFDGSISDVRIYNTARSAAQIRDFYNQTRWRYGV